ncbi:Contactin-associated protein-like 4 [Varanus komodoensis]|nr:Contactin-associated protein-like 4 [Varanus komodoensis]
MTEIKNFDNTRKICVVSRKNGEIANLHMLPWCTKTQRNAAENSDADPDTMKASFQGFIGCLSSVQFNHIAPLKAALHHSSSAPVTVKGHVIESSCGTSTAADATSNHSGPIDEGEPLANAIRSDSAVIGGVIAVVIFILLCIAAIAVRIYKKKTVYKKKEAQGSENEDSAETALKSELNTQNAVNENQKEYFF